MIQNHLLQLMALTAMEEPIAFDAESLLTEKLKVLKSVEAAGEPGRARVRTASTRRPGRAARRCAAICRRRASTPKSTTDTYAIKLEVDEPALGGGPLSVRTGKRLGRRVTEIAVISSAPRTHRSTRPPPRSSARTRSSSASSPTRA